VTEPVFADTVQLTARVLAEGYGPGAWHGADMKAALAGVSPDVAFRRPGKERHSIAEIAVHHAFYQHAIRGRLLGVPIEPFALEGDDWFALESGRPLSWPSIVALVADLQAKLVTTVADIESGRASSPLSAQERFDLLLGITCHAVYHAGQIQLVGKML
jgi:hypothetical protein